VKARQESGKLDQNQVRLFVYKTFVEQCRPPSIDETADAFHVDREDALEVFLSLERAHVFVLAPETHQVTMAMPFSAVPTAYSVRIGASSWWAN
jgi:hypothetical protein